MRDKKGFSLGIYIYFVGEAVYPLNPPLTLYFSLILSA